MRSSLNRGRVPESGSVEHAMDVGSEVVCSIAGLPLTGQPRPATQRRRRRSTLLSVKFKLSTADGDEEECSLGSSTPERTNTPSPRDDEKEPIPGQLQCPLPRTEWKRSQSASMVTSPRSEVWLSFQSLRWSSTHDSVKLL